MQICPFNLDCLLLVLQNSCHAIFVPGGCGCLSRDRESLPGEFRSTPSLDHVEESEYHGPASCAVILGADKN